MVYYILLLYVITYSGRPRHQLHGQTSIWDTAWNLDWGLWFYGQAGFWGWTSVSATNTMFWHLFLQLSVNIFKSSDAMALIFRFNGSVAMLPLGWRLFSRAFNTWLQYPTKLHRSLSLELHRKLHITFFHKKNPISCWKNHQITECPFVYVSFQVFLPLAFRHPDTSFMPEPASGTPALGLKPEPPSTVSSQ